MKTHPNDCLIVGVVGRAGAGKDELAEYLCRECGAQHLSIGDLVREIANERGMEKTRQNLHTITREIYQSKGQDHFINRIISKIEAGTHKLIVISGIRSPMDVEIFRERYGDKFLLVSVVVNNPRMRFGYIHGREDPRDPQDFESFSKQDDQEENLFRISATLKKADIEISNNNSLEHFHTLIRQKLIQETLSDYCNSDQAGAK
jgi:dephospho-CoA kinase